jgi:hypothetical protein
MPAISEGAIPALGLAYPPSVRAKALQFAVFFPANEFDGFVGRFNNRLCSNQGMPIE